MTIPYRTQRVLKRILLTLLVIAAVLAIAYACWFVWIQRYIVYTAEGKIKLDFDLPPMQAGQLAVPPEKEDIPIKFDQNDEMIGGKTELTQLDGYYVELSDLQDIAAVKSQIQALPAGTAVMVDVKGIKGDFFYSSAVGSKRSSSIDTAQMDELIDYLNRSSMYAIAKLPALRDWDYGLNHVPDGVHHSSGGYLYMDDDGCYWLHPGSQGTLSYLTQIIMELKGLGFDEVVLEDFCFPETTSILVNGDKAELLSRAASVLLSACATDRFAVSFVKTADFTMPSGRTRMYVKGMDALQAADFAPNSGVADTAVNLVFLTELHDTRFDVFGAMRPLSGAH
ncbi:MAG: hypothetical protein E7421_01980 [Ruminococcaceae bacterium]|nr:hypothetical protein [Oscillospiraceae bacterium]